MAKKKKVYWSVFITTDRRVALVRRRDKEKALKKLKKLGINYKATVAYKSDFETFSEKPGSAWKSIWSSYKHKHYNVPKKFNLKKIAKCDNVIILDNKGNNIKQEYVRFNMSTKEKLIESAKTMAKAGGDGTKLAAAGRAQNAAYDKLSNMATSKLGISEETMQDPKMQAFVKSLIPFAMHSAASMFEDKIPHAGRVKDVCEVSITETSRETSEAVLGVAFDVFNVMVEAADPNARIEEVASKTRVDVTEDNSEQESEEETAKEAKAAATA